MKHTNEILIIAGIAAVVYYFVNKKTLAARSSNSTYIYTPAPMNTTDYTNQDPSLSIQNQLTDTLNNTLSNINVGDLFGIGGNTDTHDGS